MNVAKIKRESRGRKPRAEKCATELIAFRATCAEKASLRARATREELDVSAYVREVLAQAGAFEPLKGARS